MAHRLSRSASGNTSSATLTGPASTGVVSGDVVFSICTFDNAAAVLAAPTGFTALDTWTNTVDGQRTATAYKVAGSSEPATYDWSVSGLGGVPGDFVISMEALSGRSGAAPTKSAVNLMDTASASPQTVGFLTLTAVAGDDLVLASAPDVLSPTATYTWTAPTNYTLRENATQGTCNSFVGTRENVSAGATGTVNATLSWTGGVNGGWGAVQYAFAATATGPASDGAIALMDSAPASLLPGPWFSQAPIVQVYGDTTTSTNQTFTITLAGLLSPTGALLKSVTKTLAGSLATNSGALLKTIAKVLGGSSTPTGALLKTIAKLLSGSLSTVSGALVKTITKVLGGSSTPTGAVAKTITKPLGGSSTPTGALLKTTTKTLAGSSTPTGALSKTTTKAVSGSTTPTGALQKTAGKTLAGSTTPTGSLLKTITKVLGGTASPTGALAIIKVIIITLAGSISPTGSLKKTITKPLGGSASPSGSLLKTISKFFGGTAAPSGSLAKTLMKVLAGTLSSVVGILTKTPTKSLGGSTAPSGAISKTVTKTLSGSSTPGGSLLKVITKKFAGTLAPTGSVALSAIIIYIQQQLRLHARSLSLSFRPSRKSVATARDKVQDETRRKQNAWQVRSRHISIRTVGPEEMLFKAGTAIEFETTFTDADGALYDPDTNTVKMYVKKPDGTYYTGYVPGVSGAVMTKQSIGVYRATFQSLRTDPVGTWTIETEGKVGTETSLDDIHIQLKA